ncbi:hypothetical protein [Thauera propionica]|uniref:hypothetical protein n=1 Tax=Thauera propionica TaxID=2019431 RepID=UPI0023F47AEC|nr:hypothetical protein [Thauera propionica]
MKMAKATAIDIDVAMDIANIVGALENRYRPALVFGDDDEELFLDMDSAADLRAVVEKVRELALRGSLFRVVWGMAVLLDPSNEVVDPDADHLEIHPKISAMEADAARYRLLRAHRPGLLLDMLEDPPTPNSKWAAELDKACDERLAALPSTSTPSPASGRPG